MRIVNVDLDCSICNASSSISYRGHGPDKYPIAQVYVFVNFRLQDPLDYGLCESPKRYGPWRSRSGRGRPLPDLDGVKVHSVTRPRTDCEKLTLSETI